jgi:hypothetical protein
LGLLAADYLHTIRHGTFQKLLNPPLVSPGRVFLLCREVYADASEAPDQLERECGEPRNQIIGSSLATHSLAVEHELEAERAVEVFLPDRDFYSLVDEHQQPRSRQSARPRKPPQLGALARSTSQTKAFCIRF